MPIFVKTNVLDSNDITSNGTFKNEIVREGLQCHYDTNNYFSYPNGGSTWYNLAADHTHLASQNGMGTTTFNGVTAWNMNFDGAYLVTSYGGTQPNAMATFEAWIYASPSEVTSGDRGCVILLNGGGCSQYMSWNKSSQYLSTYWYCSTDNGYHETNGPTPRRSWTHWCTVWDARAGKLYQYVNGISVGVATTTESGSTGATSLTVGREGSSRQFSGGIAEVRVYNRSLHPHEVLQNYNATRQKYQGITSGALMWVDGSNYGSYPASGGYMTDLSGNGRGVSLVNGYSYSTDAEGSIYFDGIAGMGLIGSSAPDLAWSPNGTIGNSTMTIEMWVKTTDSGGILFTKPWNGSGQYNIFVYHDGFQLYAGTVSNSMGWSTISSTNTYKHVVVWMNSTTMGYYINGGEYSKGSQSHGITGAAPSSGNANVTAGLFTLYPYGGGWGGNTGFSVEGRLGTCKVYNRVLSESEVKQAFRSQKTRFGL